MNEKRLNLILGIAVAVFASIAVFTLFAEAFADIDSLPASRGTIYTLMFDYEAKGYNPMPLFIVGWAFLLAAIAMAFVNMLLPGKLSVIGFAILAILLLGAGIIFCFSKEIFLAAGNVKGASAGDEHLLALGAGPICALIFSFLGAILSGYGAYKALKA
ncbi:MAG: hypothetical protein HUJ60_06415 [Bacilli bacterium]|nr:hypothetical protein [Bacilli bacterium]